MPRRTLEDLTSRWGELPPVSAHFGQLDDPALGRSWLLRKLTEVLGEPSFEVIDPFLCEYLRAVSEFVTLPFLPDDTLEGARLRLDALGPRIAAVSVPNDALAQQFASWCLQLAYRIASGWLDATADRDLEPHARALMAVAEAATLDLTTAEAAGLAAFEAAESAMSTVRNPRSPVEAERNAAIYQATASVDKTNYGASWVSYAREDSPGPLGALPLEYAAWAPTNAAEGEWPAGESPALWSAREASVTDPAWWAGVATRTVDEWWEASEKVIPFRLTPAIRDHIRADAEALLVFLEVLLHDWERAGS